MQQKRLQTICTGIINVIRIKLAVNNIYTDALPQLEQSYNDEQNKETADKRSLQQKTLPL